MNKTPRKGEQALNRIGFDGERLIRLAHRIAHDYLKTRGATLTQHRTDELISFLVEHGIRAAIRYDHTTIQSKYGTNGGNPAASWLADILENRCTDWYRSKAEGNGDRRYGNDDRLILTPMDDDPDTDIDFDNFISKRRLARWQAAAAHTGWTFPDWVCFVLDDAAQQIEQTAA